MNRFLQLCVWVIAFVALTRGASNCWVNSDCDGAKKDYYKYVLDLDTFRLIKVCCPRQESKYFRAGSLPNPWCRCDYEHLQSFTCWRGEECDGCKESQIAGTVNKMPVCCSRCRAPLVLNLATLTLRRRITFTAKACACV